MVQLLGRFKFDSIQWVEKYGNKKTQDVSLGILSGASRSSLVYTSVERIGH